MIVEDEQKDTGKKEEKTNRVNIGFVERNKNSVSLYLKKGKTESFRINYEYIDY